MTKEEKIEAMARCMCEQRGSPSEQPLSIYCEGEPGNLKEFEEGWLAFAEHAAELYEIATGG